MKILTVAEFDPAGVHIRHRKYLRQLGVDYRLAVRDVYRREGLNADWWLRSYKMDDDGQRFWVRRQDPDVESLRRFADEADVIQFCPVIGQTWSYETTELRLIGDADGAPYGPIDWSVTGKQARRVAVFHGSRNAAANAAHYAKEYRTRGFEIAATTLDYVHWMDAKWIPPIVDLVDWEPATSFVDGERLRVVHAPSDPAFCHTQELLAALHGAHDGMVIQIVMGLDVEHCHVIKRRAIAGFDHLRGSFSVNSLENVALGLVNLVAVRREYQSYLTRLGITLPWPDVQTMGDVINVLIELRDNVEHTRSLQREARSWYMDVWHPMIIARRLMNIYQCLN